MATPASQAEGQESRQRSHVRTARTARSNVEVLSRWPVTRTMEETPAQAAAISPARRLPPSSRASIPVSSTMSPAARADGSRSTVREPAATSLIARAMSGVNGPWSAYPHANRSPAATKYSSSR